MPGGEGGEVGLGTGSGCWEPMPWESMTYCIWLCLHQGVVRPPYLGTALGQRVSLWGQSLPCLPPAGPSHPTYPAMKPGVIGTGTQPWQRYGSRPRLRECEEPEAGRFTQSDTLLSPDWSQNKYSSTNCHFYGYLQPRHSVNLRTNISQRKSGFRFSMDYCQFKPVPAQGAHSLFGVPKV